MEIKNKLIFKIELKKKVENYVKNFPLYFYGNIVINVILLLTIFSIAIIALATSKFTVQLFGYCLAAIILLLSIFQISYKGFSRNLNILNKIRLGNYSFGVEDHEIDNAVEFIEDLPMKKEKIEHMRAALSFNKLFNVLETSGIIVCEDDIYKIDLKFEYEVEKALEAAGVSLVK